MAPLRFWPVTVTVCPDLANAGEKLLMTGAGMVTVKASPLLVPLGVVTVTLPEMAPAGTTTTRPVAVLLAMVVWAVPLKLTLVAPLRLVPVMVTLVPTGPLFGLRLVSVGAGRVTVKATPLEVPPGVVAVTLPVAAPLGTTIPVIWVPAAFTAKPLVTVLLAEPAKVMTLVPVRLAPFRVTVLPTTPLAGAMLVSAGWVVTVKLTPLVVPLGVVALRLPVIAPAGTTTPVIWVPAAFTA